MNGKKSENIDDSDEDNDDLFERDTEFDSKKVMSKEIYYKKK